MAAIVGRHAEPRIHRPPPRRCCRSKRPSGLPWKQSAIGRCPDPAGHRSRGIISPKSIRSIRSGIHRSRRRGPSAGITNHVFNEIFVTMQLEIRGQQ